LDRTGMVVHGRHSVQVFEVIGLVWNSWAWFVHEVSDWLEFIGLRI
jgi:hypothetical protein